MRSVIVAIVLLGVVFCAGCRGKSSAPTAPVPEADPIPPMSRFDTLYVYLNDDGRVGDKPWTVSTRDTSVSVTAAAPLAAIIYDTRESLQVHVTGWHDDYTYPSHQLDSTIYAQDYPPQDSTWRLPNAMVDPCKRVPGVLLFEQGRTDYEVCNVIGQCIWNYYLYAYRYAIYWDTNRNWPASCSSAQAVIGTQGGQPGVNAYLSARVRAYARRR